MKNLLARVGIGSATVDTVLPTATLTQGETVDARVEMHGGSTAQDIDAIYFALKTQYEDESGGYEFEEDSDTVRTTLSERRVTDPFTLEPDEERTVDVSFDVPRSTPVTLGRTKVWLDTGLDVSGALDPDDRDHVDVVPGPHLDALFDALDTLGLTLHAASCHSTGSGFSRDFAQEFEFRPRSGPFTGSFDELEVVATPTDAGLEVLLEVDRREGLLSEMTDADERYERFSVTHTEVARLESEVRSVVERHA